MQDVADVGLVYAHAEGVCRDHDGRAVVYEFLLIARALRVRQARVVAHGLDAFFAQPLADLFDGLARGAVDYSRGVRELADVAHHRGVFVVGALDVEEEVFAVEACCERERVAQPELFYYVGAHLGRGGRGEGRDWRARGQAVHDGRDVEVRGAEVVAPVGNAVRLVDDYELRRCLAQEVAEAAFEPLGRDVEQADFSVSRGAEYLGCIFPVHSAVYRRGADAVLAQRVDLVFHQRYERGDDDGEAARHYRRYLIAERLARARRHDADRVAARTYRLDELELAFAEAVVAEYFF